MTARGGEGEGSHVCVCVHVHAHARAHAHVYECGHRHLLLCWYLHVWFYTWRLEVNVWCLSQSLSTFIIVVIVVVIVIIVINHLLWYIFLNLEFISLVRLTGYVPRVHWLHLFWSRITDIYHHIWIFIMGSGGLNLEPYACVASILLIVVSAQSSGPF